MSLVNHHAKLEKNAILLMVAIFITVIIGGLVEIMPLFTIKSTIEPVGNVRPYSPLELSGRNIYVREGCYLCHSQMIRPFRSERERYGHYSLAAESMYGHPFQWGSKRTGPDLARVGGKYSDEWHVAHLKDPQSVVPESVMPGYSHLADTRLDYGNIQEHLETLNVVGMPNPKEGVDTMYSQTMVEKAKADLENQARGNNAKGIRSRYPKAVMGDFDGKPKTITEMDAMVAYLQMLGTLVDFTSWEKGLNKTEKQEKLWR